MTRLRRILVPALAIGALLLTAVGCGVRDDTASNVRDAVRMLPGARLGAIPIHIDENGRISRVYGFETDVVDSIAESLVGEPLVGRIRILNDEYLDWFMRSNIQHVTVAFREEGLFFMVNGEPLPYIAWNDDTMENLVDVLGMFERDGRGAYLLSDSAYNNVQAILPVLPKLGLELRLELPTEDDVERIPAPGEAAFEEAMLIEEPRAPLQEVAVDIAYRPLVSEDGEVLGWVPSAFGLSTVDVRQILSSVNMTVPRYRLRRDIEARMQIEGIENMGFQARHDGVFFVVDGKELPHLAWSDETLTNLATLLEQLYPPNVVIPKGASWVPVVKATAPMLNDFDVAVQVLFPVAE